MHYGFAVRDANDDNDGPLDDALLILDWPPEPPAADAPDAPAPAAVDPAAVAASEAEPAGAAASGAAASGREAVGRRLFCAPPHELPMRAAVHVRHTLWRLRTSCRSRRARRNALRHRSTPRPRHRQSVSPPAKGVAPLGAQVRPLDGDAGSLRALALMRVAVATEAELLQAVAAEANANGKEAEAPADNKKRTRVPLLPAGTAEAGAGCGPLGKRSELAATMALRDAAARALEALVVLGYVASSGETEGEGEMIEAGSPPPPLLGGAPPPPPGAREGAACVVRGEARALRQLVSRCEAAVTALEAADGATPAAVLAAGSGLAGGKLQAGGKRHDTAQLDRRLEVVELPGRGRGYVAAAPIAAGERIFVEVPSRRDLAAISPRPRRHLAATSTQSRRDLGLGRASH